MFSYRTTTVIQAPAERIWGLLTDAPRYPDWNTTVDGVDGEIVAGKKITVHAKGMDRAFPVTVAELVSNERMVWQGGIPLGLFKGVRTFSLTPKGDEVEFSMEEVFTGLLAGMMQKQMPDLQPAFDEFASSLKQRAEQGD